MTNQVVIDELERSDLVERRVQRFQQVDGRVVITWCDFDFSGLDTNITSEREMKKLMNDLKKAALKAGWELQ